MIRPIRALSAVPLLVALGASFSSVAGCGEAADSNLNVERLPDVEPNLPEVPTLPPPPHPVTLDDGSYTVYGLRKRIRNTINNEANVTAFIVEVYAPPECPEGDVCPRAAAPHMYVADIAGETDRRKMLMVVGYAENQAQIDEAIELVERGRYEPPDPESGILPIPTDFLVGNKLKLNGQFTRVSGTGFNNSEGLIEYRGHETLVSVAPEES